MLSLRLAGLLAALLLISCNTADQAALEKQVEDLKIQSLDLEQQIAKQGSLNDSIVSPLMQSRTAG